MPSLRSQGRFLVDALIALLLVLSVGIFAYHVWKKPLKESAMHGGLEYRRAPYVRIMILLEEAWNDEILRSKLRPGDPMTTGKETFGRIVALDNRHLTIDIEREQATQYGGGLSPGIAVWITTDNYTLRGAMLELLKEASTLDELRDQR